MVRASPAPVLPASNPGVVSPAACGAASPAPHASCSQRSGKPCVEIVPLCPACCWHVGQLKARSVATCSPSRRFLGWPLDAPVGRHAQAGSRGRHTPSAASRRRGEVRAGLCTGPPRRALSCQASAHQRPACPKTLRLLADPRPPAARRAIPEEVLAFQPEAPTTLSAEEVGAALRTARRGTAAGLSGATAEHYRLLLEEAFATVATPLARAEVPGEALQAMALARLTALQKSNGGVRGIATADALRRLVARTLARKHTARFDNATRHFFHRAQHVVRARGCALRKQEPCALQDSVRVLPDAREQRRVSKKSFQAERSWAARIWRRVARWEPPRAHATPPSPTSLRARPGDLPPTSADIQTRQCGLR